MIKELFIRYNKSKFCLFFREQWWIGTMFGLISDYLGLQAQKDN